MAYYDQALLSNDTDFRDRIAAAAATEGITEELHPLAWAAENQWTLAAAPGFADAYASAIAGGVPDPGRDPAVISDAMILSALQALP